jgi:16S rRNA (cytosine967-C5)-methyltransferase
LKTGVEPRMAAARVVGRVVREGAWTQQAVAAETSGMGQIDRKQAEALAYGTIRRLPRLDRGIAGASRRGLDDIDRGVLDLLRVSAFELWFGRVPAPVAVNTGVEAVRALQPKAAGFANAVLRFVARGEAAADAAETADLRLALPSWLLTSLRQVWAGEEVLAFAEASLQDAPITVRHRPALPVPHGQAVPGIEGAYVVEPGEVRDHPRQDPASIAVVLALDPRPGERVADLAAAPGGKTMHIVDAGASATVAVDIRRSRVWRSRSRVPQAAWVVGDGSRPPLRARSFDAVLVDAPCSGLGTLRRRPEIRHRVSAAGIARLAGVQRSMVEAGMSLLKPNGRLVYSVCTVTPEETVAIVAGLPAQPPVGLPGRRWGNGLLMAPHLTDTDGMFISIIRPP